MSDLVKPTDGDMNLDVTLTNPQETSGMEVNGAMERKKPMRLLLPLLFVAIVAGVGTGYALSNQLLPGDSSVLVGEQSTTGSAESKVEIGKTYGSTDTSTFKDSAEGVLLQGGANGEGSHRIVREGGESQTVYLTSSVIDLKLFENHLVEVRGETFAAQRAGWLMDVGQLKVLELNAPLPDWAQAAMEEEEQAGGSE